MRKISMKLAFYFFIVVFLMEVILMFYLHQNMLQQQTEAELQRLMTAGQNHRDVLQQQYTATTLEHIVLMESNEERAVIIVDDEQRVLAASPNSEQQLQQLPTTLTTEQNSFLTTDWQQQLYIISVHPFETATQAGYVIMFLQTAPLHSMFNELNEHFILSGLISGLLLLLAYVLLSRMLTKPLIRMKEATERLSKGQFSVKLVQKSNDELGELANAIETLAQDLQRVQEGRNEFLAAIAHELSTPLTYLSGYAAVAKRPQLSEQQRQQYLTIIVEEAASLKQLVHHLLEAAKLEEPQFTVLKQPFAVAPFIERIATFVQPAFVEKNIHFTYHYEQDLMMIADEQRLEQVLHNLLDNARHYSDAGSTVTLTAAAQHGRIAFVVSDTGIGIAKHEHNAIFERLYRVEKSRSRRFGGMGIGLAVVKEIVEAHDGEITVHSELGKGTTITIWIG